jgi:hypothetical protein
MHIAPRTRQIRTCLRASPASRGPVHARFEPGFLHDGFVTPDTLPALAARTYSSACPAEPAVADVDSDNQPAGRHPRVGEEEPSGGSTMTMWLMDLVVFTVQCVVCPLDSGPLPPQERVAPESGR